MRLGLYKKRRTFRDADQAVRCQATVTLRDGSPAQCGRPRADGWGPEVEGLCSQHAKMGLEGKAVRRFNP